MKWLYKITLLPHGSLYLLLGRNQCKMLLSQQAPSLDTTRETQTQTQAHIYLYIYMYSEVPIAWIDWRYDIVHDWRWIFWVQPQYDYHQQQRNLTRRARRLFMARCNLLSFPSILLVFICIMLRQNYLETHCYCYWYWYWYTHCYWYCYWYFANCKCNHWLWVRMWTERSTT